MSDTEIICEACDGVGDDLESGQRGKMCMLCEGTGGKPIPGKLSVYELMPIAKLVDEHDKDFYPSWGDYDPHPNKDRRDKLTEDEMRVLDTARGKHRVASEIARDHREAVNKEIIKRLGHLVDKEHEFAIYPLRGDKAIIVQWYSFSCGDDWYNIDGHHTFHLVTSSPSVDMILVTDDK